jgi:hypothetical protein
MDASQWASLGIALPFIAILLQIIRVLWADNQALRERNHEDQAAMLPALTAASAVMDKVTVALIARQAIQEHESGR